MDQNRGSVKVPGVKVMAQSIGKDYALYCGDSCEVLRGIPDSSIHYSINEKFNFFFC